MYFSHFRNAVQSCEHINCQIKLKNTRPIPTCILIQEPDRHLLLDVGPLQRLAKVVERNFSLTTLIGLQNCALRNRYQLFLADVGAHHHVQNIDQFIARHRIIVVQIVHFEGDFQLLLAAVQLILLALLDRPEVGQHLHELSEIDTVIGAVRCEECMDDAIAQRIDGQFGNA
jgi:hypothetical protein